MDVNFPYSGLLSIPSDSMNRINLYYVNLLSNVPRKLRFKWLLVPLIIVILECIIYYRMFFYTGYIQWGNFLVPLKQNLLGSFSVSTWNPYGYSGMPMEFPWPSILSNFSFVLFYLFGGFFDMNVATKIYIFVSTFAIAYSFYILTGKFLSKYLSRIIAVLFFLLSPALLQQIAQGDFVEFFIYGIYFISISLLSSSLHSDGHKKYYLLIISLILVSITVIDLQLFYLGVPLYLIFMFYFSIIKNHSFSLHGLLIFLKDFTLSVIIIILFFMPIILPSLFGAFNLSPSSSVANPLSNFIFYSSNFFDMLLMNPFHNIFPSASLLGNLIYSSVILNIWSWAVVFLVIIIVESAILFRDIELLFLTFIILMAALLGSGYAGPISDITVIFYMYVPGYQLLNASYFWEWIVITPLYAITIGILLEKFSTFLKSSKIDSSNETSNEKPLIKSKRFGAGLGILLLSFLVVLIIVFPLIGQGFYGGSGIHQNNVPLNYGSLSENVTKFVGESNLGVAYFTPDNYVYYGNSTIAGGQPLLINTVARYAGIPTYGAPPLTSNNFFYWLYTMFYLNRTHEVAQLFSIMGIKYFVTLNKVISASSLFIANTKNATKLMQYQKDVKLLYSTANYSVFESTFTLNMANGVYGFSLMSSNYNILMQATKLSINLTKIVPVFSNDINSTNFNFFLGNTTSVIFSNPDSLMTLAIDRFSNSSDTINPLTYTSNYYDNVYEGWVSSTSLETNNNNTILSDPYPFALTATNKPISTDFRVGGIGNYSMFVQVLLSSPGSKLQFTINGSPTLISAGSGNLTTGSFGWTEIHFNTDVLKNKLNIQSLNGENGVQRIVIVKSGMVTNELNKLKELIKTRDVPVLYMSKNISLESSENLDYYLNISQKKVVGIINNESLLSSPVEIINNPNGYKVYGIESDITIVRYEYYKGMVETVKGFQVYPIMGGINFVLLENGNQHKANFVSVDYKLLLYGVTIYVVTIFLFIIYLIVLDKKTKYKK